jgi:hypothetical protein
LTITSAREKQIIDLHPSEIFTKGYLIVQEEETNITFAFGKLFSKNFVGLPSEEHRYFFIEALEVIQKEGEGLSPLNFVFVKEKQVQEFCTNEVALVILESIFRYDKRFEQQN